MKARVVACNCLRTSRWDSCRRWRVRFSCERQQRSLRLLETGAIPSLPNLPLVIRLSARRTSARSTRRSSRRPRAGSKLKIRMMSAPLARTTQHGAPEGPPDRSRKTLQISMDRSRSASWRESDAALIRASIDGRTDYHTDHGAAADQMALR